MFIKFERDVKFPIEQAWANAFKSKALFFFNDNSENMYNLKKMRNGILKIRLAFGLKFISFLLSKLKISIFRRNLWVKKMLMSLWISFPADQWHGSPSFNCLACVTTIRDPIYLFYNCSSLLYNFFGSFHWPMWWGFTVCEVFNKDWCSEVIKATLIHFVLTWLQDTSSWHVFFGCRQYARTSVESYRVNLNFVI